MDVNMNGTDSTFNGLTKIFSIHISSAIYIPCDVARCSSSAEWNEEKCSATTVDVVVKLQLYHELPIIHLSLCILPSFDDKKPTTFELQQFSFLSLSLYPSLFAAFSFIHVNDSKPFTVFMNKTKRQLFKLHQLKEKRVFFFPPSADAETNYTQIFRPFWLFFGIVCDLFAHEHDEINSSFMRVNV